MAMATLRRVFLFLALFSTCRPDHTQDRRLLLHSDVDINQALTELRRDINATKQDNLDLRRELNATQQSHKAQLEQEINAAIQNSVAQKAQLEKEINVTKQESLAQKAQLEREIAAQKAQFELEINATKQESLAQKERLEQEIAAQKAQFELEINTTKQESLAQKAQLEQEIVALKAEVTHLKKGQGSTYVRWGRTTCPANGTEKVYSGFAAGSDYNTVGGASSSLCLPDSPSWAYHIDGIQNFGGMIYGAEFHTDINHHLFGQHAFGKTMQNEDVPCALCHSSRPTSVMIPASTSCFQGWTLEYTGYLMTSRDGLKGGTDYTCVDKDPEAVYHGESETDVHLLYFIEVQCGTLPCQEYPQGRELACVVCSK